MADSPENEPKVPGVAKILSRVRHTHALRRKAAVRPMVEERRRRQKKSRQDLKKSIKKPTSGHKSARPNRHASKREKIKRYTHA